MEKMEKNQKSDIQKVERIELKNWHSKDYLIKLSKTTYKDKKVVFILPNGKEFKIDDNAR